MKVLKPKLIIEDSYKPKSGFIKYTSFLVIFIIGFYLGYTTNKNGIIQSFKYKSLNKYQITESITNSIEHLREYFNNNDFYQSVVTTQNKKQLHDKIRFVPNSKSNESNYSHDINNAIFNNSNANINYIDVKYTLQIAAFETDKKTQSVVSDLKNKGLDAYSIIAVNSRGNRWHLVRIGVFNSYNEAYEHSKALYKSHGLESQIEILEPPAVTKLSNFEIE